MDCQQIINLVMKKANEDKEFKKKLIENSKQTILDETGYELTHEIKFYEDKDGKLLYKVPEEACISDDELENITGGVQYPYDELSKKIDLKKRPIIAIKYGGFRPHNPSIDRPGATLTPEETKKRLDESKN